MDIDQKVKKSKCVYSGGNIAIRIRNIGEDNKHRREVQVQVLLTFITLHLYELENF